MSDNTTLAILVLSASGLFLALGYAVNKDASRADARAMRCMEMRGNWLEKTCVFSK